MARFDSAALIKSDCFNAGIFRVFCVTGPLRGEFTGEFLLQKPVTRSIDVFFDLRLNKRLCK